VRGWNMRHSTEVETTPEVLLLDTPQRPRKPGEGNERCGK
jgi:hypothetical protein